MQYWRIKISVGQQWNSKASPRDQYSSSSAVKSLLVKAKKGVGIIANKNFTEINNQMQAKWLKLQDLGNVSWINWCLPLVLWLWFSSFVHCTAKSYQASNCFCLNLPWSPQCPLPVATVWQAIKRKTRQISHPEGVNYKGQSFTKSTTMPMHAPVQKSIARSIWSERPQMKSQN